MREFEVELETADGVMDTFVCHPEEGGAHPGVIIYMDAPAIREELRDMARRIATVGYYVILPNLYYRWGREGSYGFDLARIREDDAELQKMFDLMNALTNAGIVSDTAPMLKFLRDQPEVAAGPLGCVGYCMSGQFVVWVGASYPDEFAAIASYYGVKIITDKEDSPHKVAHQIKGELYFAFAENDHHVPQAILDELPGIMAATDVPHRIEIYPGTTHGFAFPQRADYKKAAAERHWERMFALFERRLKG